MLPEALAKSTPAGFLLVTNDAAQDELAGPFPTYQELETAAAEMKLEFCPTPERKLLAVMKKSTKMFVRDMAQGALFRIDDSWYRMSSHIPGNTEAIVAVVGEKRTVNLPVAMEVTELSVLSMR